MVRPGAWVSWVRTLRAWVSTVFYHVWWGKCEIFLNRLIWFSKWFYIINLKFLTNILIINETKCSFKVECDYWWTHVWEKRTRNLLCFLLIFIENIPAGHLLLNNLFRQRKLSIYCHICSTFNFHERPAKCLYTRFTLISTLLHDC